jgi:hypothetical protein
VRIKNGPGRKEDSKAREYPGRVLSIISIRQLNCVFVPVFFDEPVICLFY